MRCSIEILYSQQQQQENLKVGTVIEKSMNFKNDVIKFKCFIQILLQKM